MTVATISTNRTFLLLTLVIALQIGGTLSASEIVSVRLVDGKSLVAEVHPRTSAEHLWLRFGGGPAVVLRAVAWQRVASATVNGQPMTAAELQQLATRQSNDEPSPTVTPQSPTNAPTYAEQARKLLGFSRRITAVDFDARIANWDRDVEFDGLALSLFPLDADGQLTRVHGTLHVEVVAARRHGFNDAPSGRGQVPTRLGQWTVAVNADEVTENGVVVKLPFKTNHPEFDTKWATHGLVHVRFVVPGHGVFEHSFDGVRVRPYAPMRDQMERQSGQRFLPTERTGVGKRVQ